MCDHHSAHMEVGDQHECTEAPGWMSTPFTHRRDSLRATAFLGADAIPAITVFTITVVVVWSVLQGGVPYLRHDWRIADDAAAMRSTIASMWEPWLAYGIGEPQPYPTFFLVGFALTLFAWLPPVVIVAAIVAAGVACAAVGAASYARLRGAPIAASVAVAAFAALNPWVYSKLVAGHLLMVLAYGLWWLLVAELARPHPRAILPLLAALAVTQIEFLVLGAVPLVVVLARKRQAGALVAFVAAALPILAGLLAEYGAIRSTPYLLPWQIASAVPAGGALVLRGYEFAYDRAFDTIELALIALAAVGIVGLALARRKPFTPAIAILAAFAIVYGGAATSVLSAPYAWLVLHVVESGVFREQYDLLAVVAIAYAAGIAEFCVAVPSGARAIALVAFALAIPWIAAPVAGFTVPASALPLAAVPRTPTARVAFVPAFQPVTLRGRGSGFDPDVVARAGDATPLNTFLPAFPVDRALARLQYAGDDRGAAALGTTAVIARPALQTDEGSLRFQSAATVIAAGRRATHAVHGALPLFGAIDAPAIVRFADDPAARAIGVADPGSPYASSVHLRSALADRSTLDAGSAWVDLRLATRRFPMWSNPYGGAFTRSRAPLVLKPARSVLAGVQGVLRDDRHRIVATTEPMAWRSLQPDARELRCEGTCAVAAFGDPPERIGDLSPRAATRTREWRAVFPWLVVARLHGDEHALRYAVRYDPAWLAWDGGVLQHGRLAGALNVWWVGPGPARSIVLIEATAALQTVLEVVAVGVIVLATVRARRRPSHV